MQQHAPTVIEPDAGTRRIRIALPANGRTLLAVGVTVLCWASAFPGIRAALHGYSPAHVALLRYLIASVVLAGYAAATRMGLPHRRDLPGILLTGFIGIAVHNIALNTGETHVACPHTSDSRCHASALPNVRVASSISVHQP
ncbi:MAG: EamA family transporter [Thermomicrobiales bacterium]